MTALRRDPRWWRGARGRARRRWIASGALVAGTVLALAALTGALTGWPGRPIQAMPLALGAMVAAVASAASDRALRHADRVLVHTIVTIGLVTLVAGLYLGVVVGFGGVPDDDQRATLTLSIAAAALVGVLAFPARQWLVTLANRRVHGTRLAPADTLRTFATRMSRAVPLDELLLQLAESLRRSMALDAAEVWTGEDGRYERIVSVPDRPRAHLEVRGEALSVAARARLVGPAWLAMWVPDLLEGRTATDVRAAVVVHLGQVLGFVVVERRPDGGALSTEDDEQLVLVDIARQLGLVLHNARLDTALQASLVELRERNAELVASRARIVAATDESRRHIERDLHDGAQQHVVALAVKVNLVRQLLDTDGTTARALLDELRADVQATLTNLRELAHGIYPPLLRDRGLAEALQTAANRSPLGTTVVTGDLGRYDPDVEAAIYFCCLEAIQNAGKHAGDGARLRIEVVEDGDELTFTVSDDGVGFLPDGPVTGRGFVNMRDRLGAFGGSLTVRSAPGDGTSVSGRIRIAAQS